MHPLLIVTRSYVNGLYWVIKVGQINRRIGSRHWLVLCLCNEKFVFTVCKEFAFLCVDKHVRTVYLWCRTLNKCTISTLNSNFNFVVLKTDEW